MTSTVIKCTRPRCGGTIDGGYCGICGVAQAAVRPGRSYRAQARLEPDRRRRIELVEAANSVRPRTWV